MADGVTLDGRTAIVTVRSTMVDRNMAEAILLRVSLLRMVNQPKVRRCRLGR